MKKHTAPTTAIDCEIVDDAPTTTALSLAEPLHNLYHRCAQTAAAQATGYAILCGLELSRIRMALAKPGGRPKKLPDVDRGVSVGWEDWVKSNCEFGTDTARKYIAVSEGVKGKLAQIGVARSLGGLLDLAPSAMDAAGRDQLLKTVSKVTDGQSLSQLYLDFGITKKNPNDNLRKGGATHHNGRPSINYDVEDSEAEGADILHRLAKWLTQGRHQILPVPMLRHMDEQLLAARETLRPFLKNPKH